MEAVFAMLRSSRGVLLVGESSTSSSSFLFFTSTPPSHGDRVPFLLRHPANLLASTALGLHFKVVQCALNDGEEQLVRAWKEEVGGTMWDARLVEEEMAVWVGQK